MTTTCRAERCHLDPRCPYYSKCKDAAKNDG